MNEWKRGLFNMEYFEKKITYLRGLCDGSGFDENSKEGKIFHGMLEILDDMAFMLETFMDDEEMEDMEKYEDEEIQCPVCGSEIPMGTENSDDLKF